MDYFEPKTISEALSLLAKYGEQAKVIAGGTDVMVDIKYKEEPGCLVNIKKIPGLGAIQQNGGSLRVGSLVTIREIETNSIVRERLPVFWEACHQFASLQIRNTATVGGNICRASPSGETLAPLLVLEAKGKLAFADGEKSEPFTSFFQGPGKSSVGAKGLLTEIEIPYPPAGSKSIYLKHAVRGAMDIAMVGVAVLVTPDAAKNGLQDVRIGLGAVAPTPIRATENRSDAARQAAQCGARQRSCGDGRIRIEPDQRSAQQRGKPPLDRRSIDPPRSTTKLAGGNRQGGSVMSLTINTTINGKSVSGGAEASTSLLEFLRDTLEYKGTKLCCNTGECGACTIIYNGKPINSCVTMAADANGAEIITIEGLANGDELHPVQQAFIDTGAVQCGYCTPGYIISVKALLDRTTKPTAEDIEEAVSGNICRCTGYNKIVDAIHLAADRIAGRA